MFRSQEYMVWMRWIQETFPPREARESARAQTNTSDSTRELPVRKIRGSEKPQSAKVKAGLNLLLPVFLGVLCRIASELLGGEKEETGSEQTRPFISKHCKWTKLIFPCSENTEGRKTRFGDEIEKKKSSQAVR